MEVIRARLERVIGCRRKQLVIENTKLMIRVHLFHHFAKARHRTSRKEVILWRFDVKLYFFYSQPWFRCANQELSNLVETLKSAFNSVFHSDVDDLIPSNYLLNTLNGKWKQDGSFSKDMKSVGRTFFKYFFTLTVRNINLGTRCIAWKSSKTSSNKLDTINEIQ